jgi:hypothetical protein
LTVSVHETACHRLQEFAMTRIEDAFAAADEGRPDKSFWTEYDHFMIEREARALRRAHARALFGRAWQSIVRWAAGARHVGGHRSAQRLSPRT